jgi:hypothetical protein
VSTVGSTAVDSEVSGALAFADVTHALSRAVGQDLRRMAVRVPSVPLIDEIRVGQPASVGRAQLRGRLR